MTGAVVSVPPPLYRYELDGTQAAAWVRRVNDGLEAMVGQAPERLRALAHLPLGQPAQAAREARSRTGPAWAGVSLGTSARGRTLADPSLEPLWSALDELEALAFVHPVEHPDPRLGAYYLGNLLGNPFETTLAAASLVFSDTLARYPRVRFCLAHAGGATAALCGRWQRGYVTSRPGLSPLQLPPLDAVRRLHVDSVAHSDAALALALEVFGPQQVLLGSDWPFPMGDLDPSPAVAALGDNVRGLLDLPGSATGA